MHLKNIQVHVLVYLASSLTDTECKRHFALIISYMYVYVIAWVAVKFGINTMSVVLEMGQISRGEAE